ncbi:MAG: hypothetical protein N2595_02010 [bacterium]|nr:hypothetical protein [bacterium]
MKHALTRLGYQCLLALAGTTLVWARTNRVYFVGNSVTDTVRYDALRQLAESRGHVHLWGRQMIPGAPLDWLWTHPGDGFTQAPYSYPTNAFPYYEWDHISLQPFDRPLSSDSNYASAFINLSLPRNTNCQFLVYGRWPAQSYFLPDYDGTWTTNYNGGAGYECVTRDYFEQLTRALRTLWGLTLVRPVRLAPVGEVMYQLNQQMKAGKIPGYTNIVNVYADGIHLNDAGAYIVGCTYFAVLYQESPVGLSAAPYNVSDPTYIAAVQSTAWAVVRTYPYAGMAAEVLPSRYDIGVLEGRTATVMVKLTHAPAGTVTVSVQRVSGDMDISVLTPILIFTPATFNAWQPCVLAAGQDPDWHNTSAQITLSAPGHVTAPLTAIEQDDDPPALVCYDGFDAPAGLWHGVDSGYGWQGSWQVDQGTASVSYCLIGDVSLRYKNLLTTGRMGVGGQQYRRVGRFFNRSSAYFGPWATNVGGTLYIGKDGTELWAAWLQRLASASYQGNMTFDDSGGSVFHDINGICRVKNIAGYWALTVFKDLIAVTSTVAVTTNVTLFALRFQFGAVTDTVSLYVNPSSLGGAPPASPDATISLVNTNFRFHKLSWYPNHDINQGWLDELRFGSSFADVTPVMRSHDTNSAAIVVNGVYSNFDVRAFTIVYNGALSGTGIYRRASDVTNVFIGSISPGFSPGTLIIDAAQGAVQLGSAGTRATLVIETNDLLIVTNTAAALNLELLNLMVMDPHTNGETNWFLFALGGFTNQFHDVIFAHITTGALYYDHANRRVGVFLVPEPVRAAVLLAAGLALRCKRW